ncbi:MAG: polysaccharide biosynthesis protein [bacterium]
MRFFQRWQQNFVPNLYILSFDVFIVFAAYILSYIIRLNFGIQTMNTQLVLIQSLVVTLIYFLSFLVFKPFCGIIRHTSFNDAMRLLHATFLPFAIIFSSALILRNLDLGKSYHLSLGVFAIHFLLVYFILIQGRIAVKTMFLRLTGIKKKNQKRVIIFGAGDSGVLTKNALLQDHTTHYTLAGFADENLSKIGKRITGTTIYPLGKVLTKNFIDQHKIDVLIVSIQNLNATKQKKVIESALNLNIEIKVVPSAQKWIDGKLSHDQIRNANIEDLLQRDPIKMGCDNVVRELKDKTVMVTGAAGSIGSGIVKQVLTYQPRKVVLLDQAESAIYDLQYEINNDPALQEFKHLVEYKIANIKDRFRIDHIFNQYMPDIIYHAAAYKHVPLMEENPYEALLVNVFGTKALADLAIKYKVKKFVMVSTDKAVNPTNIMGASKRIAEIYTQASGNYHTQFVTTRFGNVLDSNGSVVPLFRKQISKGGPVTITHKDINRFFMTIPEACSLVLEAGAMGNGGEIFVFDMGKPVRIYDLAVKMIKIAGFIPDKEIMINEVGLRPGEKLYEEVLSNEENTILTHHPKIMKAKVRQYDKKLIDAQLEKLANLILENNAFTLVAKMKEIVPEYISNNSVYDVLDNKNLTLDNKQGF